MAEQFTTDARVRNVLLYIGTGVVIALGVGLYSQMHSDRSRRAAEAAKRAERIAAAREHLRGLESVDLDLRTQSKADLDSLLGEPAAVTHDEGLKNGSILVWWEFVQARQYADSQGVDHVYELTVFRPFSGSILGIHLGDSRALASSIARKLEVAGKGRYKQFVKAIPGATFFELFETPDPSDDRILRGLKKGLPSGWVLSWHFGADDRVEFLSMTNEEVVPFWALPAI
jgi:hypothetical protein